MARDPLIDVAKGIAIIAIVLGHALRGLFAADIIIPTPEMIALDVWLYSWHLAVFALLSGLFVRRSVLKAGRGPYLARRLLLFGWLYLLWSFVQGITKLAVPSGTNSPISWQSLLTLWLPDGQLWFLPWLAIMTAFAVLTSPWASRARATSVLSLALAVSVVSWGWSGLVIGTQGWGLLIFYGVGLVVGPDRFVATLRRVPGGVAFLTGLGLLALTAVAVAYAPVTPPSTYGELRTAISVALGLVVSGLGVLGVSLLARVLSGIPRAGAFLALAGRRSLEIFLAHIIAAAGVRSLLGALGLVSGPVHLLLGTAAGVLLPLALWRISVRLGALWLFAAPTPLTRRHRPPILAPRRTGRADEDPATGPRPSTKQQPEGREDE